jgi:hypothetical protein
VKQITVIRKPPKTKSIQNQTRSSQKTTTIGCETKQKENKNEIVNKIATKYKGKPRKAESFDSYFHCDILGKVRVEKLPESCDRVRQ